MEEEEKEERGTGKEGNRSRDYVESVDRSHDFCLSMCYLTNYSFLVRSQLGAMVYNFLFCFVL